MYQEKQWSRSSLPKRDDGKKRKEPLKSEELWILRVKD